MFGRVLLKPDAARPVVYDSVYDRSGQLQSFACVRCDARVEFDLARYVGQPADPEAVLGPENALRVREHFGILSRSRAAGWPKVRVECCASCEARYLIYVAEFEPRNGWCKASVQGVTELTF